MTSPTRADLVKCKSTSFRWAPKWHSTNIGDGTTEHLMGKGDGRGVALFRTRQECRDWITDTHGYIAKRRDLRIEPHGWRMPRPVRVRITVEEL